MTVHHIASDDLPKAEGRCPNIPPTHRLCVGMLLKCAKDAGYAFKTTAFLVSHEVLENLRQCSNFEFYCHMFYVPLGQVVRHYDWVVAGGKGEWVERHYKSELYKCAPFEDCMIVDTASPESNVLIRYRRVVQMEELEFSEE